jgi:hypothetical protein
VKSPIGHGNDGGERLPGSVLIRNIRYTTMLICIHELVISGKELKASGRARLRSFPCGKNPFLAPGYACIMTDGYEERFSTSRKGIQ